MEGVCYQHVLETELVCIIASLRLVEGVRVYFAVLCESVFVCNRQLPVVHEGGFAWDGKVHACVFDWVQVCNCVSQFCFERVLIVCVFYELVYVETGVF